MAIPKAHIHLIKTPHTRLQITMNEKGFSVWDVNAGRWLIDASTVANDGGMLVADTSSKPVKHVPFDAHYPPKK